MINSTQSFTMGSFIFWVGVVENILDPEMLGRVQIRAFGYHTEDKSLIPTDLLPWGYLSQPTTAPGMSGLGQAPVGILPGTQCWGFFIDGTSAQQPIICGTFSGLPSEAPSTAFGFADPDGTYPKPDLLGEPDVNRLARGESSDTIASKDSTESTSLFDEPASPYAAEYPKNHVFETPGGHVIEIDDTAGAERIHVYHMSGTFTEIHPDGVRVDKNIADSYSVTIGDGNVSVGGGLNVVVSGDAVIEIGGAATVDVGGAADITIGAGATIDIAADLAITAGANITMEAGANCDITAGALVNIKGSLINLN